jgi:hypothetical protein
MKHQHNQRVHLTHPKFLTTTWLLSTLTLLWATLVWATDIPPAWRDALRDTGTARVIVVLNVPVQPEGTLNNADAIVAQRADIAQAQQLLLDSLQPQGSADTRFETIPALVMVVDNQTLTQLENNPLVASLQLDAADETMAGQTIADQVKELERVYESSHSYAQVTEVTVSPASAREGDVRELMVANLQSVGITVARGEESASGRQVRATNPGTCTHWNLNTDYLNSPNQKNPNPDSCGNQDVWHFMQGTTSNHDPQTYSLMTKFTTAANRQPFYDPAFFHWAGEELASAGGMPFFGRSSGVNRGFGCSARYMPANTIVGHPASTRPLIIGWRSPVTGTVSVTGGATSLDGGTIVWYVDKGATNLAYGWTANGSSQYFQYGTNGGNLAYVKVQQGDFIYLGIDPAGNFSCDTTALDISIDLVPVPTCTGMTDGLVACYPFDGNALDGSGNGNHGYASAISYQDRPGHGKALKLSSYYASYVYVPNPAQKFTTQYTVSGWFLSEGGIGYPVTKGSYFTPTEGYGFGLGINNGFISLGAFHYLSRVLSPDIVFPLSQFKYVTAVYDNGNAKLYIDGKLEGETKGTAVTTLDSSYGIGIGNTHVAGQFAVPYVPGFNGMLDDLRIYNRALSDAEVKQLAVLSGVKMVTLTVTKTGTGQGQLTSSDATLNCGTTCKADYAQNSTVTLTATPTTGNTFTQWSGACIGTTATTTVTLDQAKTCTATFDKVIPKYTLTVSKTGTGTGSITGTGITCGTDCTEDYTAKTLVTLTATPDTGFKLLSWGGACSGTATTATVTMTAAKNCTANFIPANATTFTLTVAKTGAGQGTIRAQVTSPVKQTVSLTCNAACATGSYDYPLNNEVSLTASPATGFTFKGWSCNGSYRQTGTPTLIKVTMDAAKTCTATFE